MWTRRIRVQETGHTSRSDFKSTAQETPTSGTNKTHRFRAVFSEKCKMINKGEKRSFTRQDGIQHRRVVYIQILQNSVSETGYESVYKITNQ